MDKWFEDLVREQIWKALQDLYGDLTGLAAKALKDKLNELNKGEIVSSSPLVAVTSTTATTVTFLVRGRMKFFGGAVSPFTRIEVTISKNIPSNLDPPIKITNWHTVIGDLQISKKNTFKAELGFGWDKDAWLGRGMFKILPAKLGLDVLLGGLSDRGLMVGLDVDFPAPVPLGSTGLGLAGVGGDFAYNFVPRLEKAGATIASPTAVDYVTWAKNPELDRWLQGPIDKTAVGTGIRADLLTLADNGYLVKLEPIGLAVLIPGPVFILGGKGQLVKTDSAKIEGYLAVDIPSESIALGLGVEVKIPKEGQLILLHAQGTLDAFFSFRDPSLWYVNFGTNKAPVKGKILKTYDGELFLMISNDRVLFGAGISIGGEWKWSIIKLTARLGARVAALVGWNPQELEGAFKVWGELGLKVWKVGLSLLLEAEAIGHTPKPTQLDLVVRYKVDLPWPVPDVKGSKKVSFPEATPEPPDLESPLLSGTWVVGNGDPTGPMKLGAVHPITGRQWQLDQTGEGSDKLWPDAEIILPFTRRVIDTTGTVVGAGGTAEVQGGYDVTHTMTKVELRDLVTGDLVPGVKGVWAAGPGGDSARMHLLGQDPFAWLSPHTDVAGTATETPPATVDQYFGIGPPETFTEERRFGEVLVDPAGKAKMVTTFAPPLPKRVLRSAGATLRFADIKGSARPIDQLVLFVIIAHRGKVPSVGGKPVLQTSVGTASVPIALVPLGGHLAVAAVIVTLPEPTSSIEVTPVGPWGEEEGEGEGELLLYGVRYRRAPIFIGTPPPKTVLTPSRYRLTIEGDSTATFPDHPDKPKLPAAAPVSWKVDEEFWVGHPESLRPYIAFTTAGDNRLFLSDPSWNPTMFGTGFPAYREYRPVVRFLVPYMLGIFPSVRVRIAREVGAAVEELVAPTGNTHNESALPEKSKAWLAAHGGGAPPDQELVFPKALPPAGPASLTLSFDIPGGKTAKLDEWGLYVSQFDDFRSHVAWPGHSITVWYNAAGRHTRPPCPAIGGVTWVGLSHVGVIRIDSHLGTAKAPVKRAPRLTVGKAAQETSTQIPPDKRGAAPEPSPKPGGETRFSAEALKHRGPLLDLLYPGWEGPAASFPEEHSTPPSGWTLPSSLTQHLKPLDDDTATRFLRFARDTGARFNEGGGDRMAEIADPAPDTTIEAVVDDLERPLCLWLRTREPLDWRRVTATLEIHHVKQTGACPSGYDQRTPLKLDIDILPSPDASSAFLVGSMKGDRTHLPRGEYRLTLNFDAQAPGLPRLHPSSSLAPGPESLTLSFIQPLGFDWPLLKPPTIPPPEKILDILAKLKRIGPTPWPPWELPGGEPTGGWWEPEAGPGPIGEVQP